MSDLFKSRSSTTTLDAMLTPEQKAAMASLADIGQTGGDSYTGSLGDFNMTDNQALANNKLFQLLSAGSPDGYNTARNTLTGMANTKFNPDDPSSGFAAYSREVARATNDSNDVLNREAAITGDRYSTSIGRNKQDLALRQNDLLSSKLADLYNSAQDRSYNAANALTNLESQNADNTRANLTMGFDPNQGGLQSLLNTAKAQAQYKEFVRTQDNKMNALNSVLSKNVQFGQMSKTTKAPSIFSSMLGQVSPILGTYNTTKYGAENAPNQANLQDMAKAFLAMGTGGAGGGAGGIMNLFKSAAIGGL